MLICKWFMLQLFAGDGAGGDGGGEGAVSGESTVDAGQQRLRELGVPESKIRKNRAYKLSAPAPQKAEAGQKAVPEKQATEQAAAAENPSEEPKTDTPARLSWDEIMADPEYNKEMQNVVSARLRTAKAAEENLGKMAPAMEVLARKYNLDPNNLDYDALAQAISDDNAFYENKALEMGVPLETAKKIDQEERATSRQQREQERTLEQQKIQQHIQSLEQQGEAMKKTFPGFDLKAELRNPVFARLTAPNSGLSVEDAYFAVHRKEIQTAAMQVAAQKTAQKISNSIQAGSYRPNENGASAQAPSVTTFDYRNASPEQRSALKKRIREAAARGEKVYPGR